MITGSSAEDASKLAFAFNTVGPGADAGAIAIGRMENNLEKNSTAMEDGSTATKGVADKWKELGVSVDDANGNVQSGTQIMLQMADVFHNMPDGVEKSSLAIQTFGRNGVQLLPFLNEGSDGIKQLGIQAQDLGLVMTGATVQSIHQSEIALNEFDQAMKGIQVEIGSQVLPVLAAGAEAFIHLDEGMRKTSGNGVLASFAAGVPGLALAGNALDLLKDKFGLNKTSLEQLDVQKQADEAATQKQAAATENAAGIIDKANAAQKQGYFDVAASLKQAADDIAAGHDLEAKTAQRMASEEEAAHKEAEQAAQEHARAEQAAWDDIHQASMKAIDSKPIEALAYQKAAALEAQGYGDLAKAAIQSGEEQQSAADKAAEAQKQAAQKAEEAAKQAQEAAKQAQEAAKQAAATYQQEVDAAQTAQGQIAGVYAQYDKMYSDDEAKLNTALHGKHDLTAAEAQAELASVQQSMQQQIQAVNTAIGTVEALKRQETGVMTAEDRKQLDSQVATAQGELTAAQNAYTEMATTATNDQAIIDAAAKQTTQDIIQGIHDQVAEQDKLRTEDTSRFSHNLATQKDLFDASLSYAIESHKKGLDAQQQAVEDAQNNLARIQAAGQAAALRADAELQRREIDLEEAKAQMEIDLATAELTAKTGVWNAELSLSSSTSAAQVTDAQAVGRANVDAATAAENAWVPAYIKIDEAALNHAQIQVDAAQTAKQYAIEAAAAATKAAQQALQNAQDASSTASAAISKTAQDATDAWGRSVKAMEDNAKGLEATMGKVAGSIGEMLSSAFNVGGGAGSSGSSGLFGTNSSPQPSFGGGGGSGSGSGSGWAPPQTPPSIPAWAQAQGYWEGQTGYFNGGPVYQLMQGDSIVPGGGALLQQWANNPSNPATPIGPAVTIGNVKEVAAAVASAIATGQTTLIQQNGYAPGLTVGK